MRTPLNCLLYHIVTIEHKNKNITIPKLASVTRMMSLNSLLTHYFCTYCIYESHTLRE